VLVNRGWVPPNWKAEWRETFMGQQPQGEVAVSGVVQGSESPSSYVPQNQPQQGSFFWLDVPGLVSGVGIGMIGSRTALLPLGSLQAELPAAAYTRRKRL
jgi:cytochrome oxidase assembly protein ShyY1